MKIAVKQRWNHRSSHTFYLRCGEAIWGNPRVPWWKHIFGLLTLLTGCRMLPVYSVFRWFRHGSHSLELIITPVWSVPAFRLWTHIVPGSSRKVLYGSCFGQGAPVSLPAPSPLGHWPQQDLQLTGRPHRWALLAAWSHLLSMSLRRKTLSGSVPTWATVKYAFLY